MVESVNAIDSIFNHNSMNINVTLLSRLLIYTLFGNFSILLFLFWTFHVIGLVDRSLGFLYGCSPPCVSGLHQTVQKHVD